MSIALKDIKASLGDGLLSFPITDLDSDGNFVAKAYAERIDWFVKHGVSSVFVAGGTGEFFSLSEGEYRQVVETATETVSEKTPVISSAGRSIPQAIAFAKIAEEAGINALLLMPPYLTAGPQDGLVEYARTIMQNTNLPVIYYNRRNGALTSEYVQELADSCPNFIGLKDGTGDMQELNDTIKTVGDRLTFIGGVPTAEIIAEAYLAIGVNTYSSAVFNFAPELVIYFYKSLRAGDLETVRDLTNAFYIPFVRLRSRKKGYAISLIKAGARIIGRDAEDVRAPLVMPTPEECELLKKIISDGEKIMT